MARTRLLKPDFFDDEKLTDLPLAARLLFEALWTLADREGRLEDRPEKIAAFAFPYDKPIQRKARKEAPRMLDAIVAVGLVQRYEADGIKVLWLPHFADHQKVHDREAQSSLPLAPNESKADLRRAQGEPRRALGVKSLPVSDPDPDPVSVSDPVSAPAPDPESGAPEGAVVVLERPNIFKLVMDFFGPGAVNAQNRDDLLIFEQEHPPECIEHCFERARLVMPRPKSFGYIKATAERHRREGCNNDGRSGQARQPARSGARNGARADDDVESAWRLEAARQG